MLRYETEFMEGHKLNLMTAYNEEYWFARSGAAGRDSRVHPNITEVNGALTATQRTAGASEAEGLRSYLGRLNYSIHDKYLLELNFRVDGSSKFLPGHQYGFFPSGSIGWRFSEENFFDGLRGVVSSGKFRASYGSLGNNSGVTRYEQKNTFGTTTYAFNGNNLVSGFAPVKMINSDFTWEKTTVTNIGLDLGFLNNKLQAEIDLYNRKTTGMIRPSQLSTLLAGYSAPRMNIGDMRNRGVELTLRWMSSVGAFNYGAVFNYSRNWETLLSWNETLNPGNVFLNMPYQFTYSQTTTGIAQTWQDIANAAYQGNNNISPGDLLYADVNGDGQTTGADAKAYANKLANRPTANYSLNLFGSWKGIELNVLFQAATGRMNFWRTTLSNTNVGGGRYSYQEWHLYDTWTLENRGSSMPRIVSGNAPRNDENSTYNLQNMNYLRLKNVQLSYNLSSLAALKNLGVQNLRFFVSAENVFTLTKWSGVDPEKANEASEPYPLMKSVSVGLNIGF
jgi:TonB-linked SusC/RagA family outer membrane protein